MVGTGAINLTDWSEAVAKVREMITITTHLREPKEYALP